MEQFRCKSSRQKASDLQTSQVQERERTSRSWHMNHCFSQCSMNKTSRQKWSIHSFGTGESVAEVLNLLLTFCSSSMSEFPEMLKKDTNWDQDIGTKMELLFLFVSAHITLAKSFSQSDAGMSLMFTRSLRSLSMMTTGTTSTAFLARFDRGLSWRIFSESRNYFFRLFYLCWIFPLESSGII